MSTGPLSPLPVQRSQKSTWTTGKIVALVLVIVLIVGVSGFAGLNYLVNRPISPSSSSRNCTNGATNYPGCNVCSSGQTLVGQVCYSVCPNGATNPPACSNSNTCSNGATDFPQCTVSSCSDPGSISSHVYNPSRLQIVKQCVTASGTVDRVIEENDGDVHLRLSLDSAYANLTNSANVLYQYGDLVVEIVCVGPVTQADAVSACQGYTNNIPIPNVGEHVTVSGPYVLDTEHYNWAEIHPVYALTTTGASVGATVYIEENLDISYASGATNGWLGPTLRTVVPAATVGSGNQYTETLSLHSTSVSTEQITSFSLSTPGFSIVSISPSLPIPFDPRATVGITLVVQAPDAYYHGPLDIQVSAT
jgi:hypothetical protein